MQNNRSGKNGARQRTSSRLIDTGSDALASVQSLTHGLAFPDQVENRICGACVRTTGELPTQARKFLRNGLA
jgi:hypothetical protein